jgi:hypothetical protein
MLATAALSTAFAAPLMRNTTGVHPPPAVKAVKPLNPGNGLCSYIEDYLPSFCSCTDKDLGGVADCQVSVLDLDTIGVKADIEPCAQPFNMDLEITEADMGIDYQIASLTAGEDEDIPVPGLSIGIPFVGSAGINMAVKIDGNLDALTLSLGVDACISDVGCGSDLLSSLPIWLLNTQFDFSDLCEGKKVAAKPKEVKLVEEAA